MSGTETSPTALLLAWRRGDAAALDQLMPMVHDELRRLARRYMAQERPDHTLQPTALVNEAYLRLIEVHQVDWQNRGHFFAMAARVMRRVLVDAARAHGSVKRGDGVQRVTLDPAREPAALSVPEFGALDEALHRLESLHPRQSQVVELRFFGGLTLDETADVLHVSRDTIKRDWQFAKLWLLRELGDRAG